MPHNVEDVIKDIEDVKSDLHRNVKNAGRSSMGAVLFAAMGYVEKDADWHGNLRSSLSLSVDDTGEELTFTVHTDAEIAPYAPFVEFGTGSKTERTSLRAPSARVPPGDDGSRRPPNYPYESPSNLDGLIMSIIEWVETKPVFPENDDMTQEQLGYVIAAEIVENGTHAHPFLRPAWFDNELIVKDSMVTAVRRSFS